MSENTDNKNKEIPFYPDFLFREAVTALLVVAAVVALALYLPMKVGDPADPSDSAFIPRPEWYFMAPFYLVKIFPASLEAIPTVIAPGLLFLFLVLFPFFDKNPERRPAKRPLAMAGMTVAALGTVACTILGLLS